MTKIKSLVALCIVVAIVSTWVLSASASITSTTSVHWNANETEAWAKTIGNGPASSSFYVTAWIESASTDEYEWSIGVNGGTSTAMAETASVTVTYPSPIPLVDYGGSHAYN